MASFVRKVCCRGVKDFGLNFLLGITNDQCSVDAEYFTSEKSCQNSSSSGFDKEIISEDLPMIDVFLNKEKRKNLLLMEEVMRLVHSTQPLTCESVNVIFGSERSSRNDNVCSFVRPGLTVSRAHNLHLLASDSS